MTETAVPSAGSSPKTGQESMGGKSISLVSEMGWGAVFLFAITSIGLTYSGLLPFSTITGQWPGVDLVWVLTVAAIVALINAYTFASIGTLVHRNGSDYLLASRVLSPPLAFASSWTLVIFMALAGGTIIASIMQETLPMFARALSLIFGDKRLLNNLEAFSSPEGVALYGTIGVLVIFSMLIFSAKANRRFLLGGFVLALMAWLFVSLQFASASPADFQTAWEKVMGESSYLTRLIDAHNHGMQMNFSPALTVLAGLVFGLTIFFGYYNATFFAKEVKDPEKNLLRGSWSALLVSWGLFVLGTLLVQRVIPLEWLSAQSYLARLPQFAETAMPWLPFYSLMLHPNILVFWLVTAFWGLSLLALAHTFLYTSSRIILAWVEDNLIPSGIDFVHPVLRSPLIAVLVVSIMAEVGVILSALQERIGAHINLAFFLACVQVLPVLAITLLPFLRKEWFAQAPLLVRRKIGPIPLITLVGLVSLVSLGWAIASLFLLPGSSAENLTTIGMFVGIFALGLAWFFARKYYLSTQGQDLTPIFKTLTKE